MDSLLFPFFRRFLRTSTAMTAASLLASPAYALPQGGQVVGGQATISNNGSNTTITQSTHRGIINWQSFDIGAGEHVQFIQPSNTSVTLNRVMGGSASQIMGSLTANGTVMLVNPQGTFIGPNASVNVGSFLATTSDITNDRFMAGDYRFDKPGNGDAVILNQGTITVAEAGLAALVAPNVVNEGVMLAKLGTVQLASGDKFTLDLYGDGLISLEASDAIQGQLVRNSGMISAQGGKVLITAATATEVVNSVINMEGIVEATSIGEVNGEIVIFGSKGGEVLLAGTLDASGKREGERGGNITVTADSGHITLKGTAVVDASGHSGTADTISGNHVAAVRDGAAGGDIRIGGDYKGGGDLATAQNLTVESGATILNDSLFTGDAGRTILWSDGSTQFYGSISSRAYGGLALDSIQWGKETGANPGNGGFVETSGKQFLTLNGLADTRSAGGNAGTWLLDPATLTFVNRSNGTADGVNTINGSQLEAMSALGNVSLSATGQVTFSLAGDNYLLASGHDLTITSDTGDIRTNSAGTITASGNGSILLEAGNNIVFSNDFDLVADTGNVTLQANNNINIGGSADITTQGGGITINSDRDADASGRIAIGTGSELRSNGGNITLGGGTNPFSLDTDASTNAAVGGGTNHGVTISGATLDSGSGSILIHGAGGVGQAGGYTSGIRLDGNTTIRTTSGDITLTGYGPSNGGSTNNNGINLFGSGILVETDTGRIAMVGRTDASSNQGNGIRIDGSTIRSNIDGEIHLQGWGLVQQGILIRSGGHIVSNEGEVLLEGHTTVSANVGLEIGGASSTRITSRGGNVTLHSDQSIRLIDAHITSDNNSAFDITLNSDRDATGGGRIRIESSTLNSSGGNITFGGGLNPTDTAALGVSNISRDGISINGSVIDAEGGDIMISGAGHDSTGGIGVRLEAGTAVRTNGTGTVMINGTGTNGGHSNHGVWLTGSSAISAVDGNVTVEGIGGGTGSGVNNHGVYVNDNSSINVTGIGNVSVVGKGGNLTAISHNNRGVWLTSNSAISAVDGNVTVEGIGGGNGTGANHYGVVVDGASAIANVNGDISITSVNGNSSDFGLYLDGANAIHTTGTGNIAIGSDLLASTATISTSGNGGITLSGSVSLAGSLLLDSANTVAIGGTVNGGHDLTINAGTISLASDLGSTTPLAAVSLTSVGTLNLPSITAGSIFARSTGAASDLTIVSGATINASGTGNAITLVAGRNFINSAGAGALLTPSGRWLIHSTNPANDTIGGLTNDFRRFSCTYGGSCLAFPATGNGFLYSFTPVLTVSPVAMPKAEEAARVQFSQQGAQVAYGFTYSPASGHLKFISTPKPSAASRQVAIESLAPSSNGQPGRFYPSIKPPIWVDRRLQREFGLPPAL